VGIGRITVDGQAIEPAAITATREGDALEHRAVDVSPKAPVAFRRGDVVTFRVRGHPLAPGKHRIEVEIFELNMGRLSLSLEDAMPTTA
jgi:hypothetical protein